jgi:hypothetical protein
MEKISVLLGFSEGLIHDHRSGAITLAMRESVLLRESDIACSKFTSQTG